MKFPQSSGYPIVINKGGTLTVNGTSASPATFTSYADDSFGGDSNSDGVSSGTYGDYWQALDNRGGKITATYLNIQYSYVNLTIDCGYTNPGVTSVTNSIFTGSVYVSSCTNSSWVSMQKNQFGTQPGAIVAQYDALKINNSNPAGILLSGTNKNTFSGSGSGRRVTLTQVTIPTGSTWSVDGGSNAVLTVLGYSLNVAGTLNLNSGTTVKGDSSSGSITPLEVVSGGVLNVNGTATDPVMITSVNDDSVGGDTNNDTSLSSPAAGDYDTAIYVNAGGRTTITHASIQYAATAINMQCGGSVTSTITDSSFANFTQVAGCSTAQLAMQRNTFGSDDNRFPALQFTNGADPATVVLSGTNKNTFSGTGVGREITILEATVASGSTWSIDGASNVVLALINGTGLTVDGTMNIGAGTVVKRDNNGHGIDVNSGGLLNLNGTNSVPVWYTSYTDDSHGGDTNNDGASSGSAMDYAGSIQLYGGNLNASYTNFMYASTALVLNSGTISLNHSSISQSYQAISVNGGELTVGDSSLSDVNTAVTIGAGSANFANTDVSNVTNGLQVSGGTDAVTFRGSFSNVSGMAITACNWGTSQGCSVDASYVDWGSLQGPLNSSGPSTVACGAVTVNPWVYGGQTYNANDEDLYGVGNCDESNSPAESLSEAADTFHTAMNQYGIDCSNGFSDACDQIDRSFACLGGAISSAQSLLPFSLPTVIDNSDVAGFAADTATAAGAYMASQASSSVTGMGLTLAGEIFNVASTFYTLAGAYSACVSA